MKNFVINYEGTADVQSRTATRLYEIGTQIRFYLHGDRVVAARRIPVMFA